MIDIHKRQYSSEALKQEGKDVVIAGWAAEVKSLGKIAFIKFRDREGYAQIVTTDSKLIKQVSDITKESVILIQGKVKKSKLKSGANEIELKAVEVLTASHPQLPIDISGNIDTDLSKRLDNRFLDLRNPRNLAIFKVRSKIGQALREFLFKEGFVEMQTPKIVAAGAEGGATLFTTAYYGKKAYLSQSQQLYKQMMNIAGFDKVFEIGPSFRAEKSHTVRHISEFTHVDIEFSFIKDEEDLFKLEEQLLVHVLNFVNKNCKPELELLGVEVEVPKIPFPRVTFKEAIQMLNKEGVKVKEDIGTAEEKILGELVNKKYKSIAYFLCSPPWTNAICKFYWMRNGDVGRGGDLEYKNNEISTGAQREHRYDVLVKQIKEKGLKPNDFESYLTPFRYGAPPHCGLGLGLDRLTMFILNLPNIKEAVLFPRDAERLTP